MPDVQWGTIDRMTDPTPTLGQLILTSGRSYRHLAEASGLSKSRIGQMAADQIRQVPTPTTINSLAEALNIPAEDVETAALKTLSQERGPLLTTARRLAALDPRGRRIIQAVLRALEEES